jgi:hypothetical protein
MSQRIHMEHSDGRALRGLVACAVATSLSFFACSGPKDGQVFTGTFPSDATFTPVSTPLEWRCGTLDCHGSSYRNLRIYGKDGLRAARENVSGIQETTEQEIKLNYDAVVSIEPEKFSDIVKKAGQGFDKWIMITKGTNAEHHKGGGRFVKGDATYVCLFSWVTGSVNMDACTESTNAAMTRPGAPPPAGTDTPPDSDPPQP